MLEITGSGGESYVFVHGTPGDRRVWRELAALAPAGAAVVLVDLPDHGEAPDEPTSSLEPLEQAVLEAVEAAPGEVTVVGHSLGAWLVAATSPRMQARVSRSIAIAGMSAFTESGLELRRGLVAGLESGAVSPAEVRESVIGLFLGAERTPALEAELAPMLDLSREHWIRVGRRLLRTAERPPGRLGPGAVVIHATRDAAMPLDRGEELAERSGAELVTIDTSSHMLPLTHARELAAIIYRRG